MGTFHSDRGELHGITVVVDTRGPQVFIGRCDTETTAGIVLLDVDVHADGENGESKADFVRRAAKLGHWSRVPRVVVPGADVTSVRRLADVAGELAAE